MKNYKIKTIFVSLEGQNALANQTDVNFIVLILIFVENCLYVIHDFSVWLRTGSDPVNINQFQFCT